MGYNILGVNPFHNGSICVLSDGEIVEYIEEERLTKKKYDELPFKSILNILQNYKIDAIAIAGINTTNVITSVFDQNLLFSFFIKLGFPSSSITDFSNSHHLTHISTAFYNSGFKNSIGIVIDSGGSTVSNNLETEADSIFLCSYPSNFKILYQNTLDSNPPPEKINLNIGQSFESLCLQLGFISLDGGKIMGLSSYGKENLKIPKLFTGNKTNPTYVNFRDRYNYFFKEPQNLDWHYNKSKLTDLEKDLSWKLQTETQTILGNYIEKAIQETKLSNVVVAGGYGLNCVANYYLKKRFPKANFYFEPIAHDGGTAIGAAKLLYYNKTQDTTIHLQKTLYYGPKYSKEDLLKGIQKYLD
jgi:carbamoyltransferase